MSARRIFAFSTISALVATLAMGCSSATTEEEEEVSVDDITPDSAQTVWALAELCDGNITRHSAVKAQETAQGVVRWQCGDREGDGDGEQGGKDPDGRESVHGVSVGAVDPGVPRILSETGSSGVRRRRKSTDAKRRSRADRTRGTAVGGLRF